MAVNWTSREIVSWKGGERPAAGAAMPAMFSAEQLDAWQRNITLGIAELAEDAAVTALQEQTVQAKQEVIAKQMARSGGIAPLYTQVIDDVADAPLTAIKPDSIIVLVWNYMPEVAAKTYQALVQRSPRLTGRYIEGLLMFVDGVPGLLTDIKVDTKTVTFVASVPYARRLEVGKTLEGRPWVKQVAPHIVEETAIVARSKFSDLAAITYQYQDLSGAYTLSARGMIPRHFEGGMWKYRHSPRIRHGMLESEVRYPAIVITSRD